MGFSNHYSYGEEILFISDRTGKVKKIVDRKATIVHFPGIVREKTWTVALEEDTSLEPVIRYRSEFEKYDEHTYIIIWQVQPDGRYWEDEDGFGASSAAEICLYALLDEDGNYKGPFQVYKVGATRYLDR